MVVLLLVAASAELCAACARGDAVGHSIGFSSSRPRCAANQRFRARVRKQMAKDDLTRRAHYLLQSAAVTRSLALLEIIGTSA